MPQNLRQRYLDKIIDENLRLYATEKEAFDKVGKQRSMMVMVVMIVSVILSYKSYYLVVVIIFW